MNVSFLSSTGTFGGLMYNLKKVDLGVAKLVYTQNMQGLGHLSEIRNSDYLEYMTAWSERNSRIKNAQFHVAISVKGREKNGEELLEVAKQWFHEMGYKDVPAMFFFHNDTDNNHIHIVASRIDREGKKIKDNNEIRRGLSLIRKIRGVDLSAIAKERFYSFEDYKLSTKAQYATLWTQQGYRVWSKEGVTTISKEGIPVLTLPSDYGERKVGEDLLISSRASEIRELFARYSQGLSREDLVQVLKDKHNIELAFYGSKEKPYGYSIIDHNEKKVYKGGDVLGLKDLLSGLRIFNDREQMERVNLYARYRAKEDRLTTQELRDTIKKWGLYIKGGEVMYKSFSLGVIDEDIREQLYYNDRLQKASSISVPDFSALEALASYYRVDPYDITPAESKETAVRDLQGIYAEAVSSGDMFSYLKAQNVSYVSHGGKVYLIDLEYGEMEEMSDVGLSRGGRVVGNHSYSGSSPDLVDKQDLNTMLGLNVFDDTETSSSVDNSLRKRRR